MFRAWEIARESVMWILKDIPSDPVLIAVLSYQFLRGRGSEASGLSGGCKLAHVSPEIEHTGVIFSYLFFNDIGLLEILCKNARLRNTYEFSCIVFSLLT